MYFTVRVLNIKCKRKGPPQFLMGNQQGSPSPIPSGAITQHKHKESEEDPAWKTGRGPKIKRTTITLHATATYR